MVYHVLTLFPDMINEVAGTSILGRALSSGAISLDVINIRDYSVKKTKRVDDYPYGGGAGMVMEAEPVFQAVEEAKKRAKAKPRVIYMTPQAPVLTQVKTEELAREEEIILLCGHYEGIDERVLEEVVDDYISIGDYVLTGGELGACVLIDAVSRFVPGVLSNKESSQFESLQDNLLEYPQYTRPENWHGKAVPEVLLCGDHEKVEKWRYEESVKRTELRRPDLLKKSRRINVIYSGSERTKEYADSISNALSRYGKLFDYNRAKLRKAKLRFAKSDLLIVVTDAFDIKEALLKVTAHESDAVFISLNGCIDEDMASFFEEKGFNFLGSYNEDPDSCDIMTTAFSIRKMIGQ